MFLCFCLVDCGIEIPTIIHPSATIKYPSATGSIIVGISVCCVCMHEMDSSVYLCAGESERMWGKWLTVACMYVYVHVYTCMCMCMCAMAVESVYLYV